MCMPVHKLIYVMYKKEDFMNKKRMLYGTVGVMFVCVIALSGCAKKDAPVTMQKQEQVQKNTQEQQLVRESVNGTDVAGKGQGEKRAMPREVVTVCMDKSSGDTCEIEMTDPEGSTKTMNGTCQSRPDDAEALACVPARMQGGPRSGGVAQ